MEAGSSTIKRDGKSKEEKVVLQKEKKLEFNWDVNL